MPPFPFLPFDVRLNIYEEYLARFFDAPGIWIFSSQVSFVEIPLTRVFRAGVFCPNEEHDAPIAWVKQPVPPVLQAEAGEARSRLLEWLAKRKGINPDEGATLKFRDRAFIPECDFLYLHSPEQVQACSESLDPDNWGYTRRHSSRGYGSLRFRIRRIALLASIRHTEHLPLFLRRLDALPNLKELMFAFVELDRGELRFIDSVPKKNPAVYTLERLRDGDIKDYRRKLSRSIEGLEAFIRPMLCRHSKDLKITACKMIPRS